MGDLPFFLMNNAVEAVRPLEKGESYEFNLRHPVHHC
jgi:hypothetical protein